MILPPPKPPLSRIPSAFTLIELLVVITIIAVLTGILLPVLGGASRKSQETTTLSNMRQFGVAALLYANDNNNQLPNRAVAQGTGQTVNKWPALFHQYIPDLRAYTSPIPAVNGKSYTVTDPSLLLSNDTNYTSYIINGYNDLGAYNNATISPQLNNIPLPSQTILFGIPYPMSNNFYMDFVEGNNNTVLNRTAFGTTSVWVFTDGSSRILTYNSSENMNAKPASSGDYTDWLWLINKSATGIIQ
jgi:prepilin-type N-terminal cleavage/methylation domain-containing protein